MRNLALSITALFILQSCVVSTATKAVTTVAKVGVGVVKGTVKGIGWAVGKAKGKISEDKIDGKWKLVGIYKGNYNSFANDKNPEIAFTSECVDQLEIIEFNSKKSKFRPIHCNSEKEDWVKYKMEFGKNPQTKEKENFIEYNSKSYISLIDATNKTMVLEGNLINNSTYYGTNLFFFEKK